MAPTETASGPGPNSGRNQPTASFAPRQTPETVSRPDGASSLQVTQAPAAAYVAQVVAQAFALSEAAAPRLPQGAYEPTSEPATRLIATA